MLLPYSSSDIYTGSMKWNDKLSELWFTHTRQIRLQFVTPSDNCQMGIMKAKVCRNERSVFWTMWDGFDPDNEKHNDLSDVAYIEAKGLKWRALERL